jgi:adenosylcobinamide-GDP ribazoletransferase
MNKLKQEWIYFWTAMMFFTRIPIPFSLPYSAAIMNQSQKYYAWTGLIVGIVYALCFYLSQFIFGFSIAIILAIIAGVLLTGAFHEDGFADVCDSFGGGYGKEKIMEIMKDSRIGAYGVVGIVLLLLLKFTSLLHLAQATSISFIGFILIFANTASRYIAATTIYTHVYVRDTDSSKAKPIADKALPFSSLLVGLVAIIIPFFLGQYWQFVLTLIPAYLAKICLAAYFKKHIGGYTGDCLGAIQQVTEIIIYLSAIVIWKYI